MIPKHIVQRWGSARAFKLKKRRQLRYFSRAISDLYEDCAYLPDGGEDVDRLKEVVDRLKDKCSVKKWGR